MGEALLNLATLLMISPMGAKYKMVMDIHLLLNPGTAKEDSLTPSCQMWLISSSTPDLNNSIKLFLTYFTDICKVVLSK
jgi:hypothetical protein